MQEFIPSTDGLPYGTRNGKLISIKDAIHMEQVEQYRDAEKAKRAKKKAARKRSRQNRKANRR